MDTSETYRKMCDCPEIQDIFTKAVRDNEWEHQVIGVDWGESGVAGMQGHVLQREPVYGLTWSDGQWFGYNGKTGDHHFRQPLSTIASGACVIWLPRQDQLQEMADIGFVYISAKFFGMWCDDIQYDEPKFTSMEQLWLAFVMKEKHSKTWNGQEWVA